MSAPGSTPTRAQHCTHPEQAWCDCDWCRYLRAVQQQRAAVKATVRGMEG